MNERCYICDAPADEQDHFPTPRSLGGVVRLPICLACHDAKDRTRLCDWDPAVFRQSLQGIWDKSTAAERLALAKMMHIVSQAMAVVAIDTMAPRRGASVLDVLDSGVATLGPWPSESLRARALNAFDSARIVTVRDLTARSRQDLLKFRNVGPKVVRVVVELLESHNLSLRGS